MGAPGAAHHLLVPDLGAAAPRGWGVTPSGGSSPGGGAPRGVGPAPGGGADQDKCRPTGAAARVVKPTKRVCRRAPAL